MNRRVQLPGLQIAGIVCAGMLALQAQAGDLGGAWSLEQYVMQGTERSNVSGLLVMADGRFGLIYTMEANDGSLAGRAHSGDYAIDGDEVVFDVRWWPEDVDGGARAAPPVSESARVSLDGDRLALTFGSGSIQRWQRIVADDVDSAAGAWEVEALEEQGTEVPVAGLLLFADGRFTFVYEGAGGVHARGGTALDGPDEIALETQWAVAFVDGEGRVSNSGGTLHLTITRPGLASLSGAGATYRLRR